VTCYAFVVRRVLIPLLLVLGFAAPALAQQQRVADPPPPPENRVLGGRSSFWGSNRPAEEPYRWRLLGIGIGLIGITGFVMFRLVKKANREREARDAKR